MKTIVFIFGFLSLTGTTNKSYSRNNTFNELISRTDRFEIYSPIDDSLLINPPLENSYLSSVTSAIQTENNSAIDDLTRQNIAQALWMKEYNEDSIPENILAKIYSDKNSNSSYASRFKMNLQLLTNNQISFITSRAERYQVMMEHANTRSPQQCYASMLFLGPETVTGYEPIPSNPDFTWPQIDSPQFKNQVGWHFFVGNFTDEEHHHYSVQVMFWHYALLPPPLANCLGLSDIENQTLEMHLAISDEQTGIHYRANTVIVAGTTGLVNFTANPFSYSLGKNSIQSLNKTSELFPVRLKGRGWDMGKTPNAEIGIDISLKNITGYFFEGDSGCAPSIDGIGTLYYSAANLKLMEDHDNVISLNGKEIKLTGGSMWYDHQWGTGFMPNGAPQHAVVRAVQNLKKSAPGGWDWFMMQFYKNDKISENGEAQLTISSLHTNNNKKFYGQTGPVSPPVMTATFTGKYIDPKNVTTNISGTMQVTEWIKCSSSPNPELYPPTNTWYPSKYQFTVDGNVPDAIKILSAKPIVAEAQAGYFATGLQYIEGGIVISDNLGNEIGRGFSEGTNYANSNEGIITLAGLPVNNQTKTFIYPPKVSYSQKISSLFYVIFHQKELKTILKEAKGI